MKNWVAGIKPALVNENVFDSTKQSSGNVPFFALLFPTKLQTGNEVTQIIAVDITITGKIAGKVVIAIAVQRAERSGKSRRYSCQNQANDKGQNQQ